MGGTGLGTNQGAGQRQQTAEQSEQERARRQLREIYQHMRSARRCLVYAKTILDSYEVCVWGGGGVAKKSLLISGNFCLQQGVQVGGAQVAGGGGAQVAGGGGGETEDMSQGLPNATPPFSTMSGTTEEPVGTSELQPVGYVTPMGPGACPNGTRSTPLWCLGYTLVVPGVHPCGAWGTPLWCLGYTLVVPGVHPCGAWGTPLWCLGYTLVVPGVHPCGAWGTPLWCFTLLTLDVLSANLYADLLEEYDRLCVRTHPLSGQYIEMIRQDTALSVSDCWSGDQPFLLNKLF